MHIRRLILLIAVAIAARFLGSVGMVRTSQCKETCGSDPISMCGHPPARLLREAWQSSGPMEDRGSGQERPEMNQYKNGRGARPWES